jgi:hypothetical protein
MPGLSLKGNPTNDRAEVSDIPYSTIKSAFAMVGASSENAGSSGFVPAPSSSQRNQFLRGDGTWATPESGGIAPTTTDDITVEFPSEEVELGVVSEGDTVSYAVAQINNAINAIEDLQANKLDSDGSANDVTIQRNASIGFADIPITPITLRELVNRLGGWYSAIASKYTKPSTGIPASDLEDGVQTPFLTTTLTIATADWTTTHNGATCTKTVTGMTANALVFVKYSDTEIEFAEAQGTNNMSFTASTAPSEAVTVDVAWFKEANA